MKKISLLLCLPALWLFPSLVPAAGKVVVVPGSTRVETSLSDEWQGAWATEVMYAKGAAVQFNGNTYICVTAHQSSASDEPAISSLWSLMVAEGVKGERGPQGPAGPPGTTSWEDGETNDTVYTTDDVGIGSATPTAALDVGGGVKIAIDASACDENKEGLIRFTDASLEGCDGTKWVHLSPVPTVYSESTGHQWMDRNLGASRVAFYSTDSDAYGDRYQWGRFGDGHEKSDSATREVLSTGYFPEHGDFITRTESPLDWMTPHNNNLWQDGSGINNPCPPGFRVPTETEWENEMESWSPNSPEGAFNSPLKLVLAGNRNRSSGAIENEGSEGRYWSSTVDGSNSRYLHIQSSSQGSPATASIESAERANGYSVRCLKD